MSGENWHWGEDGASIFATVDGVDRRIAALPRVPIDPDQKERAVRERLARAKKMAAAEDMEQQIRDLISALEMAADTLEEMDKPRAARACRSRADAAQKVIARVSHG
jgi:Tfp pilus assembly protein FimV